MGRFIALAALLFGCCDRSLGQAPTADEIVRRTLAARQSIRTCYLEVTSDEEYKSERGSTPRKTLTKWRMWYSADRIRIDATGPWFDGIPSRYVQCKNYDGKGTYLNYNDGADGLAPWVKLQKTPRPGMVKNDHTFDPRILGYYFGRVVNLDERFRLNEYVGSKSIVPTTVAAVQHDGHLA